MSFETIFIGAGGLRSSGTLEVTVRAAINEAARSFTIVATEPGGFGSGSIFSAWPYPPFTPVSIVCSSGLLCLGAVDDYSPQGDARNHTVTVAGRGRGADFVDCSAVHPTGRFDNKKVEEIAQELDKFGVGIMAEVDTSPVVKKFQINQGDTCHDNILNLCQQRNLTMKGKADGSIALTRGATGRHGGGLIQGKNIERMAATLSGRDRFSDHTVKGQSVNGTKEAQLRAKGEAKDGGVPRYRPNILIDQEETTPELCKQRAQWEALRSAGFSTKATITVPGFTDDGGALWEPGWLVYTQAPWLKISGDMLIESVEFRQDNGGGTLSTLNLVDPRAYAGKTSKGASNGPEWSMPSF